MKSTTVSATHSETLYTSLPGLEIEVRYFFTSEIETDEEDFEHEQTISGLMVSINGGPLQEYQTPSVITNNGRRFLATLREAARKEAQTATCRRCDSGSTGTRRAAPRIPLLSGTNVSERQRDYAG